MTVVAAVDCGTNSTRLLITDGTQVMERLMTITRLGAGVDATGSLSPAGIARTLEVLRSYRAAMDRWDVSSVRITATSAARDSSNRSDFFDPAAEIVGAPVELLSGDEEGRLSFAGATSSLVLDDGPFLVVDIGGGSTELIVGTSEPDGVYSMDVGCVRVTERFIEHDPARPEELSEALFEVRTLLEEATRVVPAFHDGARMVGLAGTVSAVAAIEQGLASYDRDRIHHFWLTRAAAEDVYRTLATENREERLGNPGLEEARADVIVGGCIVLVAVLRFFGLDGCLVSESDILDGLAMSLLAKGA